MRMFDGLENQFIDKEGKHYNFPDKEIANGSGDCTRSSVLISESIKCLCEILIDIKDKIK